MQYQTTEQIKDELSQAQEAVSKDLDFLTTRMLLFIEMCMLLPCFLLIELQIPNNEYEDKLKADHTPNQVMFSLSWDVEELKNITAECRKVYYDLESCITACTDQLFQEQNVPKKLTNIRSKLTDIIRRSVHFRRDPASHVFVLMVSSEALNRKPYDLAVQCIPYAGLKEIDLRRLINDLCREMVSLGMDVSGKELPQIVLASQ